MEDLSGRERLGLLYGGHSLAAYLCRSTHAFRAAVVVEFNLHQSSRAERPSKDLLLRSCKEAKVLDFRGSGRVARSGKGSAGLHQLHATSWRRVQGCKRDGNIYFCLMGLSVLIFMM